MQNAFWRATSARSRAASASSRTTTRRAGSSCARSIRRPATRASSASPGRPGVGKSTLIGALVKHARGSDNARSRVLSIDPSSPFTEGALLGDRIRLADHFLDEGVYIRSMASRGALGGLSEATLQAALLMDAAGQGRGLPRDGRRRPGRDRHHRPRRHGRARPDAGLRRLGAGAQGGDHGDPRRDRRQQGQPPAHRQHGPRDQGRARARPADRLGRPGAADRGDRRGGGRGARRDRSTRTTTTSRARARSRSAGGATS